MSNTARIVGGFPSATESMQVGTTDTAVRDLDVNVAIAPFLWLIRLPLHVTLDRLGVMSQPALEFVVGAHIDFGFGGLEFTSRQGRFNGLRKGLGNLLVI